MVAPKPASYILLSIKVDSNLEEALDRAGDLVALIHNTMPPDMTVTVLNTIPAPTNE